MDSKETGLGNETLDSKIKTFDNYDIEEENNDIKAEDRNETDTYVLEQENKDSEIEGKKDTVVELQFIKAGDVVEEKLDKNGNDTIVDNMADVLQDSSRKVASNITDTGNIEIDAVRMRQVLFTKQENSDLKVIGEENKQNGEKIISENELSKLKVIKTDDVAEENLENQQTDKTSANSGRMANANNDQTLSLPWIKLMDIPNMKA